MDEPKADPVAPTTLREGCLAANWALFCPWGPYPVKYQHHNLVVFFL